MATVTVDAAKYERLQDAATQWQQHWGQMWEGRRDVMHEAGLEWGDLEPVAPDPEPSVEAMLDALIAERECYRVDVVHWELSGPKMWRVDVDHDPDADATTGYGATYADALRAAYRQVVGE